MCHCDGPEHPYDPSWCIGGPDGRWARGGGAPVVIIVQQAPPREPPQWWQPGGSPTC